MMKRKLCTLNTPSSSKYIRVDDEIEMLVSPNVMNALNVDYEETAKVPKGILKCKSTTMSSSPKTEAMECLTENVEYADDCPEVSFKTPTVFYQPAQIVSGKYENNDCATYDTLSKDKSLDCIDYDGNFEMPLKKKDIIGLNTFEFYRQNSPAKCGKFNMSSSIENGINRQFQLSSSALSFNSHPNVNSCSPDHVLFHVNNSPTSPQAKKIASKMQLPAKFYKTNSQKSMFVKREQVPDNSFLKCHNEKLIINETDTPPFIANDDICHNVSESGTSTKANILYVVPNRVSHSNMKNAHNKSEQSNKRLLQASAVQEKTNRLKHVSFSTDSHQPQTHRKKHARKREIDRLFENLQEISWAQDKNFTTLLHDKDSTRHSGRISSAKALCAERVRKLTKTQLNNKQLKSSKKLLRQQVMVIGKTKPSNALSVLRTKLKTRAKLTLNNKAAPRVKLTLNNRAAAPCAKPILNNKAAPCAKPILNNKAAPCAKPILNNKAAAPCAKPILNNKAAPRAKLVLNNKAAPRAIPTLNNKAAPRAKLTLNNKAAPRAKLTLNNKAAPRAKLTLNNKAAPRAKLTLNNKAAPRAKLTLNNNAAPRIQHGKQPINRKIMKTVSKMKRPPSSSKAKPKFSTAQGKSASDMKTNSTVKVKQHLLNKKKIVKTKNVSESTSHCKKTPGNDTILENKNKKKTKETTDKTGQLEHVFQKLNVFRNFFQEDQRDHNIVSALQRGPELRVTLEPLENTDLWASDCYLQNTLQNEYEEFRKKTIRQTMLKVLAGMDKNYANTVLRDVQDSIKSSASGVKSRKRKNEEESTVRTSVRQSECAFRYKEIVVKKHPNYIQVVLVPNSNKQNCLTIEAMKELKEAFLSARKDPNCRAVLLNSSGSFFCSGIDLAQLVGANKKHHAEEMAVTIRDLILTLGIFPKPVVAAVNGNAIGLGVSLLTFCDIVLASDKATFCIPATRLGYLPEGGVTLTLPQVVGATVAMEMLLQGRCLTAQQALKYGLVSEVLWPTQLMEEVVPRMQKLVAQSLQVMEATKTMVRCHLWEKLAMHLEREWRLLPTQWLNANCQQIMKRQQQTGWVTD